MTSIHGPEMIGLGTRLWGEQNATLSTRTEARFGKNGSKSIDLGKGAWFDHEINKGGGYRELYKLVNGEYPENGHALKVFRPPAGMLRELGMPVAWWNYHDENGSTVIRVVRFEPPGADKTFRQCRPVDDGWKWTTKGIEVPVYHLPELLKADPDSIVFVTEGEKHADALREWGLIATTNAGGARKFQRHHAETLAPFRCVILPDNDKAGAAHAADVARQLHDAGCKELRILNLPDLPEKGDIVDWIKAGGTLPDLEALVGLAWEDEQPSHDEEDARIAASCGASVRAVIDRFNAKFMLVSETGKALIYQPLHDPLMRRRYFSRLRTTDLKTFYMNESIQVGVDANRHPVRKGVADIWLRHEDRRTYLDGVVFDPSNQTPPDVLNLWEGFAIKPVPGDWTLMKDHIRTIICDGDPIRYDYLIRWIARMFQFPAEQGEVAVVLKGPEGTGKGTLANALIKIIGQHGIAIRSPKHLVGNFNNHLRDAVFLFSDEAFFAGDRAHVGVLKALITEPSLTIESKGVNAIQSPNFIHILMASNEDWVVPAGLESRRFFVLVLAELVMKNFAYFAAILKQMEAGGYAAMLHDLLAMDLSGFNVRDVPTTEGLQQQRKLSLPVPERWWQECLDRGYVFRSRLGLEAVFSEWRDEATTELLYASYVEFSAKAREHHAMSREWFGIFMRRMGGKSKRLTYGATGEHICDVPNEFGGTSRRADIVRAPRPPGYHLGDLPLARQAFADATKLDVIWDDPAD